MATVEIEVSNAQNANLFFLPIGKRLRGRMDFMRAHEKEIGDKTRQFPHGIPGQRMTLDLDTGEIVVLEPLHDAAHAELREKIGVGKKFKLPPAREVITGLYVPSCVHWLRRAVQSGLAKLVRGTLPEPMSGPIQRSPFRAPGADEDKKDKLIERLSALLMARLSPAEKKAVQEMLGE